MSDPNTPSVSVVVASGAGGEFLFRCLASLEEQAKRSDAEVIVVDRCGEAVRQRIREQHPTVQVLAHPGPERPSVPELRAAGVDASRAAIVAVIEEHCVAPPDWIDTLRAAMDPDDVAIGGPILDDDFDRVRDWVVYFSEYHNDLPPWTPEERSWLNDANAAYRRDALIRHRQALGEGYWAVTLHPALVAERARMRAVPEMGVRHTGPFDYGYYLGQRYLLSRVWGGTQRDRVSATVRWLHLLSAPIFPLFLLARMAQRVHRTGSKRLRTRFLRALPLLVPVVVAFTWGEWLGYLLGPGDALQHVE